MNPTLLIILTSAFLSSCQGGANPTKLVQEALSMLIIAGFAYSAGVLALGFLTDIKWVKHQAEERGKALVWILVVTLVCMYFESEIHSLIERASNLFNIQ